MSLDEVKIKPEPSVLKSTLVREDPTSWNCLIKLSGVRADLLTAKYCNLEVSYDDRKSWVIRDTLSMAFYDGTTIRIFPAKPVIQRGKLSFTLLSKSTIDLKTLRLVDCNGLEADVNAKQRTTSIIEVSASVQENFAANDAVIKLGESTVIPVVLVNDESEEKK